MYVYNIYVYIHMHIHIYMYIYIYEYTSIRRVCVYILLCVYTDTLACVCIQTHLLNSLLFPAQGIECLCDLRVSLSVSLLLSFSHIHDADIQTTSDICTIAHASQQMLFSRHVRTQSHRHTDTQTHALSRNTCHVAPPPLLCNTHT